ncbi:hypothetical protein [Magnetospirillum sp. 15-1]|uniref:hypothetical protein n=1 Tax=Magnetospirillum sp. 15-1 TaxID=1979370 RepID=UPI0011439061|nr:hypothetical protein [Magnetospirillum sp. 15-1]
MGYTQGLPALLAFPNLLFGQFEPGRSLAPFVVLHAVLMGLIWEMLAETLRGRGAGAGAAGLAGWATILGLLGLEAAWTLVPQLMLVEKPQIYLIAAMLLLLVRAGRGLDGALIAAGMSYLIKGYRGGFGPGPGGGGPGADDR